MIKKDLVITLSTTEKDINCIIRKDISKADTIMFTYEGNKFSLSCKDLEESMKEINNFYTEVVEEKKEETVFMDTSFEET